MKKLELTKEELKKLYHLPPKDVEKETEFQITYRMGRNSLVLELIKKIDEEFTPYIEYFDNGNVKFKGQKNSKEQEEGLWVWFYENGNIERRIPYKDGKWDGIVERFYENGNIERRIPYKDGKWDGIQEWFWDNGNIRWRTSYKEGNWDGIEEWFYPNGNIRVRTPYKNNEIDGIEEEFDEQGNITETRVWKDGKLIDEAYKFAPSSGKTKEAISIEIAIWCAEKIASNINFSDNNKYWTDVIKHLKKHLTN